MATTIEQQPLYRMLAAGEEIIFALKDTTIVASKFKVKFIAEVYVTGKNPGNFLQIEKIATLKVTPNNAGIGIFDFSRILESYVSPDYLGGEGNILGSVQYYTSANTVSYEYQPHPIHQIDYFSNARNAAKGFAMKFYIEYADSITGTLTNTSNSAILSDNFYIHNGVRQEDDIIGHERGTSNFGYSYAHDNLILNGTDGKFLTNSPSVQYIGEADYHTVAFFQEGGSAEGNGSTYGSLLQSYTSPAATKSPYKIKSQFYYNGSTTGSQISITNHTNRGGHYYNGNYGKNKILYVGIGTGNFLGRGISLPTNWDYYKVWAQDQNANIISKDYYFYKQEVCKGFEKFRLTWLNRLGVWDYFNFTKKNVRKVNSKRETYKQVKGNWNEAKYSINGYKGGTKVFSTNSKEIITLQTDYITEEAAAWLEELFTSPDVFVLQERTTEVYQYAVVGSPIISKTINKYVQPCIVTTSSYTRKTTANDKLKQYTIDIEMSHNKRIQKA